MTHFNTDRSNPHAADALPGAGDASAASAPGKGSAPTPPEAPGSPASSPAEVDDMSQSAMPLDAALINVEALCRGDIRVEETIPYDAAVESYRVVAAEIARLEGENRQFRQMLEACHEEDEFMAEQLNELVAQCGIQIETTYADAFRDHINQYRVAAGVPELPAPGSVEPEKTQLDGNKPRATSGSR
ncbi:MAG: hypothetical protein AAF663_06350 [Planctomycetota bacterium]